jgi:hypothetical protein
MAKMQVELIGTLLDQLRTLKNVKNPEQLNRELQKTRGLVMITNQIQNIIKTTAQVALQSENVNINDKKMVEDVMHVENSLPISDNSSKSLKMLSKEDKEKAFAESWKDKG